MEIAACLTNQRSDNRLKESSGKSSMRMRLLFAAMKIDRHVTAGE